MGADRVTQGPLNSAGTNPFDTQAIILDAANNTLEVSGLSRARRMLRTALANILPQTALTAITAAQTLLTQAFLAGFLNVTGRKLIVRGFVIYSTTAANVATITIAVTIGGVTICSITTSATNTAASTNLPLQFEFEITTSALGAAGTFEAHGWVCVNLATAAAAACTDFNDTNIAPSAAVNLIAAQTLTVTIAASAAIPSAQLRQATIEVVA